MTIKLMKSTFHNEQETKDALCEFIQRTDILSMNAECEKFEKMFAQYQGCNHAVFVSSGSAANLVLVQALLNEGMLKQGDRIGVSALTWSTNIMPLIQLGLTPVLIDCEQDTLNINKEQVQKIHSQEKIHGLFLTNVLGFCSNIQAIEEYCQEQNILFFEDNCESFGSEYKGKKLGNFGIASTFSFFVGHHLSTIEGGMLCTNDDKLRDQLLIARAHGWSRNLSSEKKLSLMKNHNIEEFYDRYTFYELGFNARPCEINGFIGQMQLPHAEFIVSKRQENFSSVSQAINNNPDLSSLRTDHMDIVSNFGIPVIAKNKELAQQYKKKFQAAGVEIRPVISGNMAQQPFFTKHIPQKFECPVAEHVHECGFYCGNNQELTKEEVSLLTSLVSSHE